MSSVRLRRQLPLSLWALAALVLAACTGDLQATEARLMLGSCNKIATYSDEPVAQPFWPEIARRAPAAWIWMGDNVYADVKRQTWVESLGELYRSWRGANSTVFGVESAVFLMANESRIRTMYERQRRNAGYRQVMAVSKILGTWDDHDYGMNDGDRRYPHRDASQKLFLDFLDEPESSPRRRQQGVYAAHTLVVQGRKITVILLDVRYHKTPYCTWPARLPCDGETFDFLGEEQWAWLDATLRHSDSDVNLVVSGIQILPEWRWQGVQSNTYARAHTRTDVQKVCVCVCVFLHARTHARAHTHTRTHRDAMYMCIYIRMHACMHIRAGENWSRFPRARTRLLNLLLNSGARGVLLASGDVHFAEISRAVCQPVATQVARTRNTCVCVCGCGWVCV